MKKFFAQWIKETATMVFGAYIPAALIIMFAIAASAYWPEYAWGTSAIFAVIVIATTFIMIWKKS